MHMTKCKHTAKYQALYFFTESSHCIQVFCLSN